MRHVRKDVAHMTETTPVAVRDALLRAHVNLTTGEAVCEYTGAVLGTVPDWYLLRLRARLEFVSQQEDDR
jgi:hypothetical protein